MQPDAEVLDATSILAAVDRQLIRDLSTRLIETPSPTGEEAQCAEVLAEALSEVGCDVRIQQIYDGRANALGMLSGGRPGPTVLMSGHLDTSVRGDEAYLVGAGWKNKAVIRGDRIYGNGISNMKCAFVAYVAMIDALRRLNKLPPGELLVAGTCGEIELAAIDEYQGRNFDGYGLGLRHLQLHGGMADFHILGEPTGLIPLTGVMGTLWAKVTCFGDFSHSAWAHQSTSAIERAFAIWEGVGEWATTYREHRCYGGVRPSVNRAAIRGGLPWRAARTPNVCSFYVDMRFPPDQFPIDVAREFSATVVRLAEELSQPSPQVEYYVSRPGTDLGVSHPVVQALTQAHADVTGRALEAQFAPPFCADAIDSNRVGCPTVIYGPGGAGDPSDHDDSEFLRHDLRAAEGEYVHVENVARAAAVYARTWANLGEYSGDTLKRARGPMPASLR